MRILTALAAVCVVVLVVIDAHTVGIVLGTIGVLVALAACDRRRDLRR